MNLGSTVQPEVSVGSALGSYYWQYIIINMSSSQDPMAENPEERCTANLALRAKSGETLLGVGIKSFGPENSVESAH